jgi:hypothetical protein
VCCRACCCSSSVTGSPGCLAAAAAARACCAARQLLPGQGIEGGVGPRVPLREPRRLLLLAIAAGAACGRHVCSACAAAGPAGGRLHAVDARRHLLPVARPSTPSLALLAAGRLAAAAAAAASFCGCIRRVSGLRQLLCEAAWPRQRRHRAEHQSRVRCRRQVQQQAAAACGSSSGWLRGWRPLPASATQRRHARLQQAAGSRQRAAQRIGRAGGAPITSLPNQRVLLLALQ